PRPTIPGLRGRVGWGYGRQITAIGNEGLALALERLLDHGMAAGLDDKAKRGVDLGAHIIVVDGQFGERGGDVEQRKGLRAARRSSLASSALAQSRSKISSSRLSVRAPALAILASVSPSSAVVKRTWPASVWRWMKVAFRGGDISLSPCWAVTSTK